MSLCVCVSVNLQALAQLEKGPLQVVHSRHSTVVHVVQVLQDGSTCSSMDGQQCPGEEVYRLRLVAGALGQALLRVPRQRTAKNPRAPPSATALGSRLCPTWL